MGALEVMANMEEMEGMAATMGTVIMGDTPHQAVMEMAVTAPPMEMGVMEGMEEAMAVTEAMEEMVTGVVMAEMVEMQVSEDKRVKVEKADQMAVKMAQMAQSIDPPINDTIKNGSQLSFRF